MKLHVHSKQTDAIHRTLLKILIIYFLLHPFRAVRQKKKKEFLAVLLSLWWLLNMILTLYICIVDLVVLYYIFSI